MGGSRARVLGLCGCLLALLVAFSAHADPFFVRVYERTCKVDPRNPSDEPKGPKPEQAMVALPTDLAKGPGFRPSHELVLMKIEERLWIARNQLDDALEKAAASREGRNAGDYAKALKQEISGSPSTGAAQRRSTDLPVKTPEAGFSRLKQSPRIDASYRAQNFDPLEAYYAFRRVKVAFRSGDVKILVRVTHNPLAVTGKIRLAIRSREQPVAEKESVRNAVAKSTFETVFSCGTRG